MGVLESFKERYLSNRVYVHERLWDIFWTVLSWLPVLLVGVLCFYFGTSLIPVGSILDLRIKLYLVVGKILMAIFFGQVFWQLLFPSLHTKIFAKTHDEIQPKDYNVMYGRLIFHAIVQFMMFSI